MPKHSPTKTVLKRRLGRWIEIDAQIASWRKRLRKERKRAKRKAAKEAKASLDPRSILDEKIFG